MPPETGLKLAPPSVETCHCTDGAGYPLAAAVKVALSPSRTVWGWGWLVTWGAVGVAETMA